MKSAMPGVGSGIVVATLPASMQQVEVFAGSSFFLEHEQYRGVAGFMLAHGGAPISSTSGRQPFTLLLAPQKLN